MNYSNFSGFGSWRSSFHISQHFFFSIHPSINLFDLFPLFDNFGSIHIIDNNTLSFSQKIPIDYLKFPISDFTKSILFSRINDLLNKSINKFNLNNPIHNLPILDNYIIDFYCKYFKNTLQN